uniref:Uncharacterized protein n=1 Tax=viral metagenome TaxID=1070528 RepID=A0A6C0EAS6_9ZZZZ
MSQRKKQTQKGRGFFKSDPPGNKQYKLFSQAKKSEKDFLKILKEYNSVTTKYYQKYQQHISNLIDLDSSFNGVDSFKKSFDLLFSSEDKNNIGPQSLLLNNYTDIEYFYEIDDILKYHFVQQLTYLLTKAYTDQERLLIRQITIQNVMTSPVMVIITADGRSTGMLPIPHIKYNIDYASLKAIIDQVINHMRSTLENTSMPATPLFPVADIKPATLVDLKSPEVKQDVKITSETPAPPDAKKEKKIDEVKIPENQPVLPVFKIDIPKKASPPSQKRSQQKPFDKGNDKGNDKGKSKWKK